MACPGGRNAGGHRSAGCTAPGDGVSIDRTMPGRPTPLPAGLRPPRRLAAACLPLLTLLCVAGCAAPMTRVETANAIDAVLASPARPDAERARDVYRHPKQTLLFFGLRPEMTVAEISPGTGWYTRILAPLLRDHGRLIAAQDPPGSPGVDRERAAFRAVLNGDAARFDRVELADFAPGGTPFAAPGTVDLVVTFRNVHNWMAEGQAEAAVAAFYRALKPGGVLGVVDHRGNAMVPQDPKARSGYVNQAYAVKLIEAAGFRLVGVSEVNANPKDTKDYPRGVWTLPPTYAEGDRDRAKYRDIGESDRFTLKFVKPR
jgi:predicted methyltransferase